MRFVALLSLLTDGYTETTVEICGVNKLMFRTRLLAQKFQGKETLLGFA